MCRSNLMQSQTLMLRASDLDKTIYDVIILRLGFSLSIQNRSPAGSVASATMQQRGDHDGFAIFARWLEEVARWLGGARCRRDAVLHPDLGEPPARGVDGTWPRGEPPTGAAGDRLPVHSVRERPGAPARDVSGQA